MGEIAVEDSTPYPTPTLLTRNHRERMVAALLGIIPEHPSPYVQDMQADRK